MSDPDTYYCPTGEGRAETKVKGSRFLGIVSPASTVTQAEQILRDLQKKYYDATHVCFAWRVGHDEERFERAADAGEPSGTAGAPILAAIARTGLTDTFVAVVRWYGGTKLGTGGLARAYGECAGLALEDAPGEARIRRTTIEVTVPYPQTGLVLRLAERFGAIPAESVYSEDVMIPLAVPLSRLTGLHEALMEATAGGAVIFHRKSGEE